jgi:hypothetical protein
LLAVSAVPAPCQPPPDASIPSDTANAVPHTDKHIFGIIPNFRTSDTLVNYKPISVREKYKLASMDAFDQGTFALAALFAGDNMLNNSNRSFGHGVKGYAQYFGASYADYAIGDFMTEAVFPAMLHEDPRYFRKGKGNFFSRVGYTVGQSFWTHNDSGSTGFNYSEIFGNAAGVAIATTYYKDSRTAHDAVNSLVVQVSVDTVANLMKEFWPDIDRKFRREHSAAADASSRH